jgi:uncharacterized protein YjiS (DUF1127 family)
MHFLHGSNDHAKYCAPAALDYVCPNGATEMSMPNERRKKEAKQMAYVNASRAAQGGLFDRLNAAVKSVGAAIERRRLFNRTFHELNQLSDRELTDLGIHRSSINQIALEAARGK